VSTETGAAAPDPADTERRRDRALLAAVLLAAAAGYGWNLFAQEPLIAYDGGGHMQYVAMLVDEWRWPEPLEGWSTFHPPLYHLLVALVSWPWRPLWPARAIEAVSALAMLATGALAFRGVRLAGHAPATAALAAALVGLVPCSRLAATMVGNEALTAAFTAWAAVAGLRLHADPGNARRAAAAGLAVGLALATKFTGVFAAPVLVVPYLRRGLDRRALRAAALGLLVAAGTGGLPYLRNAALTGSLVPMTRDRGPVARVEKQLTIRERRASDYLWLDPAVFRLPLVHEIAEANGRRGGLNPAMTNVWGLAYASAWYDAHELRVVAPERVKGARVGQVLLVLGLLPTGLMLAGGALSLRDWLVRASAEPTAPLTAMALTGAAAFVAFTARAPTTAAVKASYLLPLAVPAAVFFARGVAAAGPRTRRIALVGSAFATLAAAVSFTTGVVFSTDVRWKPQPPPWLTPGASAAAVHLGHAGFGRWTEVAVEPAADASLVFTMAVRPFPEVTDARISVWCGYVAAALETLAPGAPWHAEFLQGSTTYACPAPRPGVRRAPRTAPGPRSSSGTPKAAGTRSTSARPRRARTASC
jgi:4-amino-4-deoxy-L-arabinose transferase-like glycosyltransferase